MSNLWRFIDNHGTFRADNPLKISGLYFPLCSSSLFSSITPSLHGDIKTGQNSFLLQPVSRQDLHNLKSNRNFWLVFENNAAYSISGEPDQEQGETFLEAGFLWHQLTHTNKKPGFKAEILNFVPAEDKTFEVMKVRITNVNKNDSIKFSPLAAIPIYGRSAESLRDHRHVTSLLNRIKVTDFGVTSRPGVKFDERGHKINLITYYVYGFGPKNISPCAIFPTVENFIGEGGSFQKPRAVFEKTPPDKNDLDGKDAMGALKFPAVNLKPGAGVEYFIVMGIAGTPEEAEETENLCEANVIEGLLKETIHYWQEKSQVVRISSENHDFDNWFKWVNIQPVLRKYFGCSFLPDFDYGKGGRGWRDLWQDSLGLILSGGEGIREMLIANFAGTRIDGSNATIIGKNPGEFIADRNAITRVWMDHGAWPFFTTELYINQTRDIKILLEETPYFSDPQAWRGRKKNTGWAEENGNLLRNKNKKPYKGSILEHILLQNLVQFFNVGEHNNIRLENADWNDALDMAPDKGESVAFSCFYARNLKAIAGLITHLGVNRIGLLEEMTPLLDTLSGNPDYNSPEYKKSALDKYFQSVEKGVRGEKKEIHIRDIIADLNKKSGWMFEHIRGNEWLKEGFFNGYYDNESTRVEGRAQDKTRMTLTGQVFPVLSGVAEDKQIKSIIANVNKHLSDVKTGGIKLNTDFGGDCLTLGRAFSFAYGNKENGAFFNHMSVMFANALYRRGFVADGFKVINAIYKMAADSEKSKIYPCLPEYFNSEYRGMYSYLTGSASWFILTYVTEIFGVKGLMGDLMIEPKLVKEQFGEKGNIALKSRFAGRDLLIEFKNGGLLDWNEYRIKDVLINEKPLVIERKQAKVIIPREKLLKLTRDNEINNISVTLG